MSGKEKLYFLLERICDIREISPSGYSLVIDPANDLNRKYENFELERLFAKFELDDKVLNVIKATNRTKNIQIIEDLDPFDRVDDGCWHIQLLPTFEDFYLSIQEQPEYQEFTGKTPPAKSLSKQIADQFSPENKTFVLMVLREILSMSDFSVNGTVIYSLQSPSGNPDIIKERSLLMKLESLGLFKNHGEDGIYGNAKLSKLDILTLREVIERLEGKIISQPQPITVPISTQPAPQVPYWQDDFGWKNNQFVFGEYGGTGEITSQTKKKLFDELVKAKGNWVTISKLKEATGKDDSYVRATIGQIEKSFDSNLKKHNSIPSTVEADDKLPAPQQGAYRIAFTP